MADVKEFEKAFAGKFPLAGDYAYVDDNDVVLGF